MTRRGTVRIREQVRVELPWHRFEASWQPDRYAGGDVRSPEPDAGWNDVDRAIAWARHHAPLVFVRVGGREYSAGEKDDRGATPRWPGSRRVRAARTHARYGGAVYINEERPRFIPTRTFQAAWDADEDGAAQLEETFSDVEAAIDWGRERALIVLVAELASRWSHPPTYEIRSAGDDDPVGEWIERLRPRQDQATLVWAFSVSRGMTDAEPPDLAERLQAVLAEDPMVSGPRCGPRARPPQLYVWPSIRGGGDMVVEDPEPPRGWIEIRFHLSARDRPEARKEAHAAVDRALRAIGAPARGYTAGGDLRALRESDPARG